MPVSNYLQFGNFYDVNQTSQVIRQMVRLEQRCSRRDLVDIRVVPFTVSVLLHSAKTYSMPKIQRDKNKF